MRGPQTIVQLCVQVLANPMGRQGGCNAVLASAATTSQSLQTSNRWPQWSSTPREAAALSALVRALSSLHEICICSAAYVHEIHVM